MIHRRNRPKARETRAITLRLTAGLTAELVRRSRERGTSLNLIATELLTERLGLAKSPVPDRVPDAIDALAGSWSDAEADAFNESLAEIRHVDDEIWK